MAIVKLSCGLEYKVEEKFEVIEGTIFIDGVNINLLNPIKKCCNCSNNCQR